MDREEFLKILGTLHLLRRALAPVDAATLREMLKKYTAVVEEREQEDEENNRLRAEKQAKVDEILKLIASEGLTASDLFGKEIEPQHKGRGKSRPVKYAYTVNGETKYWKGVGRMPLDLKALLDQGNTLDQYLIARTDSAS